MSRPVGKGILAVAGVAMLTTVAAAVWVMGGPNIQRVRRMDERRASDLRDLQSAIEQHHRDNDRLPPDLATLARQPGVTLPVADPMTQQRYTYEVQASDRYILCATFVTDTAAEGQRPYGLQNEWAHGAGHTCFQRRVKSE